MQANFLDAGTMPHDCDRLVFSLSASVVDAVAVGKATQARSAVVINKIHRVERSGECRNIMHDMRHPIEWLHGLDRPFSMDEVVLDFGQPFRTIDDAQRYFQLFQHRCYTGIMTPEGLKRILKRTGDPRFPYYLPVLRHLAVIEVQLDDLAQGERRQSANAFRQHMGSNPPSAEHLLVV